MVTWSESCWAQIKRPIFWKLRRLVTSNMNFLIADVILFVSGMMKLSHIGMQQKSRLSSSHCLAPALDESKQASENVPGQTFSAYEMFLQYW